VVPGGTSTGHEFHQSVIIPTCNGASLLEAAFGRHRVLELDTRQATALISAGDRRAALAQIREDLLTACGGRHGARDVARTAAAPPDPPLPQTTVAFSSKSMAPF